MKKVIEYLIGILIVIIALVITQGIHYFLSVNKVVTFWNLSETIEFYVGSTIIFIMAQLILITNISKFIKK